MYIVLVAVTYVKDDATTSLLEIVFDRHFRKAEGTVLVKPHFLALQNTALILLISSAVIIPKNAGRACRKRATTTLKRTLARPLMSNCCLRN